MNSTRKSPVPCLLDTWTTTEPALYRWLTQHCSCQDLAYDLLQDTFLRALQRDRAFCDIENQKAWLFSVAKNLLVDEWRKSGRLECLTDSNDLHTIYISSEREPIESLAQCLPKALACLSEEDRSVIEFCDLQGHSQEEFAKIHHLTLTAVKSRIQRARPKLRAKLNANCHIIFDEQHKVCCFTPKRS
ncbi:sigma-70 family RNA polymerase sigma factor [Vibrio sp. Y2-5]|uniref:sigma-70 family RNA polymerase sigma factor n=1 Tax=Vibrio TaxID=662 RepID=UPI00142E2C02|nr:MULTISPECIES: sigma-70 family RNA polymerase sigma factor [Vibrio]MBD0787236.1 sigma-70 family RNA polymerase sigma factor [Vibrio sp. Y2-5]NIY94045.1 sigma-70 family RNA polymerase sigma factor [Vibrio diazotrophicus]